MHVCWFYYTQFVVSSHWSCHLYHNCASMHLKRSEWSGGLQTIVQSKIFSSRCKFVKFEQNVNKLFVTIPYGTHLILLLKIFIFQRIWVDESQIPVQFFSGILIIILLFCKSGIFYVYVLCADRQQNQLVSLKLNQRLTFCVKYINNFESLDIKNPIK